MEQRFASLRNVLKATTGGTSVLDLGGANPLGPIFIIGEKTEGQSKVATKTSTRVYDTVQIKEIEAQLNLLKNNGISENSAMTAIGYKNGAGLLVEARKNGVCKRVVYMALKGYIGENIKGSKNSGILTLTYEEAETGFEACRKAREALPAKADEFKKLQMKLAQYMVGL